MTATAATRHERVTVSGAFLPTRQKFDLLINVGNFQLRQNLLNPKFKIPRI